jgi:hypothetical protein
MKYPMPAARGLNGGKWLRETQKHFTHSGAKRLLRSRWLFIAFATVRPRLLLPGLCRQVLRNVYTDPLAPLLPMACSIPPSALNAFRIRGAADTRKKNSLGDGSLGNGPPATADDFRRCS